jgi:hypothetical protein
VEGDGVIDPEFLDDVAARASLERDAEQLFRESVRESFNWWRPRELLRLNGPAINDLVAHRWYRRPFDPAEEIDAVRGVRSADICGPFPRSHMWPDDFAKLLAGFHGKVLQVANGHMPRYWGRRPPLRDKHTNNLLFEDCVAAGAAAMWRGALKFDLEAGYRFWTAVRLPVLGAISDEARFWRRGGSGETRLDRWLYTHPTASPEQVLKNQDRLYRVEERLARWLSEHPLASPEEIVNKRERINRLLPFHSLQEAAEGIKQFWAWGAHPEIDFDEDVGAAGGFVGMYSCFNQYTLSPQLRIHERLSLVIDRLSGGFDTGPDVGEVSRPKEPRDLRDHTETAVIQFKNGRRQGTRQRAPAGYRISVTPELQTRAEQDLEFAKQRWQRRMRRGPVPAKQYPRWSTKFGIGRAEHENKQIIPAYIRDGRKWFVRYRRAEGELLSLLESPSRRCLKTRPCEFCNASSADHVALPSLPPRRALDRRATSVHLQPPKRRAEPASPTRLEI